MQFKPPRPFRRLFVPSTDMVSKFVHTINGLRRLSGFLDGVNRLATRASIKNSVVLRLFCFTGRRMV